MTDRGKVDRYAAERGVELAPGWGLHVLEPNTLGPAYLEVKVPGIAPDPYDVDGHRGGRMFPGGLAFDARIEGNMDGGQIADHVIAALAAAGLHEGLEWVTVNGARRATPHPVIPDTGRFDHSMWDWLMDRMLAVVADYRERWPV